MTLTILDQLEQGSDEWRDQRRGMITASVIGQFITPKTLKPAGNPASRSLTNTLVAERISGWTETTFVSNEMFRGVMDEPRARDLYSEHFAPVTEVGFMVREFDGYKIGFSPDGLVGEDGLIEVKSRAPKKHVETVIADDVPLENMAQLQAGLLVSGRAWVDYISYCGGLPMYVKRVEPDERWFHAIHDVASMFESTARAMVAVFEKRVAGLPTTERIDLLQEARI